MGRCGIKINLLLKKFKEKKNDSFKQNKDQTKTETKCRGGFCCNSKQLSEHASRFQHMDIITHGYSH